MGGIDENFSMFGDWSASNPSPRTFFASLIGESLLSENGNEVPLGQQQEQKCSSESRVKDEEEFAFETIKGPAASTASVLTIPKPRTGSGLAGRIAAKSGFNALKINISHATTVSLPSPAADGSSPLVTIPPGLSPTSLLDSPVFLFNSLAQPSPTTGKFPLTQNTYSSSMMSEVAQENKLLSCVDTTCNTSFAFKPQMETAGSLKMFPGVDSQSHLVTGKVLNQPERSSHSGSFIANGSHPQKQQPVAIADFPQRMSLAGECQFSQLSNPSTGNEGQPDNILDGKKQKADPGTVAVEQQSEDGYNWRKYGQKQVKGSENPRSYYKCTHPNCEAKKKVERTLEGRLIEITYQGDHLHPKPPPNRRATPPQLNAFNEIHGGGLEMFDSQSGNENKPTWTNQRNDAASYDIRSNGHDASSSLSLTADFSNPSASINTHDDSLYEYTDTIDASSTISNEDDEQTTTNQNACLSVDGNEDEPESKKRKLECSVMDAGVDVNASRAVNREPRVVVQTTSEVDILDDGYRWRKYGQKVVKGNPNPRSYYKCTSAGCPVRKHVERASHDLKSVITTYEGKHNHEVPAARNSGHTSSNSSGLGVSSVAQSHSRRPEHTNLLEGNSRFNMHPNMGSYGVPRAMQAGLPTGFSLGLGQPGMANLAMARYAATTQAHAMHPMQSYFGQRPMGELVMVVPKGEPKGEAMQSDDASEYQQFLGGPTLEPQM